MASLSIKLTIADWIVRMKGPPSCVTFWVQSVRKSVILARHVSILGPCSMCEWSTTRGRTSWLTRTETPVKQSAITKTHSDSSNYPDSSILLLSLINPTIYLDIPNYYDNPTTFPQPYNVYDNIHISISHRHDFSTHTINLTILT